MSLWSLEARRKQISWRGGLTYMRRIMKVLPVVGMIDEKY